MNQQENEIRRPFAGFAAYESFLNNDPYYYTSTKWHQRLRKRRLKCRPFSLRQGDGLFVVHDTQAELLATRLSVDLTPWHEQWPDSAFFQHLYEHNILAYHPLQLEQVELNSEVEEKLCGLIAFEADAHDLQPAIAALDVRIYAPASWPSWWDCNWRLDEEASR